MSEHPERAQLKALASDQPAPEPLRAHVSGCAECREAVHLLRTEPDTESDAGLSSSGDLPRGAAVGRYVVLSTIGRGGMGIVYLAYDPELDRRLALKLLRPDRVAGIEPGSAHAARQRLLREAQAMARLSHPNVVAVHDVGVFGESVFTAMEYVAGQTLSAWLRGGAHTWQEVVKVLAQAGRGLAAAHRAQLVHRDFKPANVLLGDDGRVRVTDFGLARAALSSDEERAPSTSPPAAPWSDLTQDGTVMGTAGYMAPEQLQRRPVDARADQFVFGITLYEALFRQRAFAGGSSLEVSTAILQGRLVPPPKDTKVPPRVVRVVLRALAPRPEDRFPSMEALLAELEADPRGPLRRHWPAFAAIGAVTVTLAGASLVQRSRFTACLPDEQLAAGIWDEPTRAELGEAFAASDKPFAKAAWASVQHRLDAHLAEWQLQRRAACEARHLTQRDSEPDFELKQRCLSLRLRELKALTSALRSPEAIDRSVTAAWGLTPPTHCANLAALRQASAERAMEVEAALGDEVLLLKALVDSGQLAEASKRAQALLGVAEHSPLAASVHTLFGTALAQRGDLTGAEASLKQALVEAEADGHTDMLARAAFLLARVVGLDLHRPKEGRFFERLGRAALLRAGSEPALELLHRSTSAMLLTAEDRPQEAVKAHADALEVARREWGPTNPLLWQPLHDLATSLINVKDFAAAVPLYREALALKEAAQGSEHPDSAVTRANLGNALFFVGQTDEAFAALDLALEARERIVGPESPRLVAMLNNLADIETKAGRHAAARVHIERAVKLTRGLPPAHPLVFITQATMAELELATGEPGAAAARLDPLLQLTPQPPAAVRIAVLGPRATAAVRLKQLDKAAQLAQQAIALESELGQDSVELVVPLLALAATQAGGGIASLERALEICERRKAWRVLTAEVKLALARAIRRAGGDDERARRLAGEAREIYQTAGEHHVGRKEEAAELAK